MPNPFCFQNIVASRAYFYLLQGAAPGIWDTGHGAGAWGLRVLPST